MRFVRGSQTFEVWIEDGPRGPRLLECTDGGAVVVRRTQARSWVTAGLYDELVARLADGWHRVHDPAREPDVYDEPREPQLEAALAADDEAAAAVYADWYQHRDGPRGDLIALQLAIAARPEDPALRAREAELRREWSDYFVGALHERPNLELSWRRGFVESARFVGELDLAQGVELMWEVLRQPSLRFLRTLEIATTWFRDARGAVALLLACSSPPPLRALRILDHRCDPSLARLAAMFPRLEELALAGPTALDAPVGELAHVRRFAYAPDLLRHAHVAAIGAVRWPRLEELALRWAGVAPDDVHDPADERSTADDLEAMLAALDAPRLRVLRFRRVPFADDLAARLVRSPVAASLAVLDLAECALGDAGALVLAGARDAFPRLEQLGVATSRVSARGRAILAAAGFPPGPG